VLLDSLKRLEARDDIDPTSVGAALELLIDKSASQDNTAFTFFTGQPGTKSKSASTVKDVEVRVPNTSAKAKGPFVYIRLKDGAGLSMADVIKKLGDATQVDVPPPNPEKAMVLVYKTERGQLRFGIGQGANQPVISATIDRTE